MSYPICKIKNITGEVTTLNGHEFAIDEIYTIQDSVRLSWANSSDAIAAITDGNFQIHDSVGAISAVTDQLKVLQDKAPIDAIVEPTSRYSMKSIAVAAECAVNTTTTIRLKLTNFAGESYTYKYLWGGEIFGENIEYGDYCRFYVEDYENMLGYGTEVELKSFIEKAYLKPAPCPNHFKADCPAKVNVGLWLCGKITTTNAGSARKIYVNFDVHNKD